MWRCFGILNSHRLYASNGPQPISLADTAALAQLEGLSEADARWLREVVTELDRVFLVDVYDKIAKEAAKKHKKHPPAGRGRR